MVAITQPEVYRREMERNLAGDRGDDPADWKVKPVSPWYSAVLAAKWVGGGTKAFLASDPYDQACVRGGMEVERRVAETANRTRARKRGG